MHFIVFFGGEFYSGNCMFMTVGLVRRRVNVRSFLYVLLGSLAANFAGCVAATYLFGRATELFANEPHLSFVRGLAEGKARSDPGVTLLRAIPANIMICISIHLGISARDMFGKLAALHFPLTVYTVAGFEHAVGNFVALPLGAMYGADADLLRAAWANLLPAIAGNFVGGAAVGLSELLLFSWDQGHGNTNQLHNHAHDAADARARALALQAKRSLLAARRRPPAGFPAIRVSPGSSSRSPLVSAHSWTGADIAWAPAAAKSDGIRVRHGSA
uniref:Formate/nitrite transporter n=1 Tax=Cryptomonas curvata TaxID=233186 RepID=A0A7S0MCY6_9CRYP|mmetsp:Transcript_35391/g.74091  ORF Transcript_35391/g.74091 Transcript_35391/m.74091 type:complete len:273 (+) Transcript_35391:352-1170(+)